MSAPQTPAEMEFSMLEKLEQNSGKDLEKWLEIMSLKTDLKKMELMSYLRKDFALKNSIAYLLMQIQFNNGRPVYGDPEALLQMQYDKNQLRGLYDTFNTYILNIDKAIKIGVCKGYTSYIKDVQFMVAVPKPKEIRIGLALGNEAFEGKLEKAKSLGANEKMGHQIVIRKESDLDDELLSWMKKAYSYNMKTH